MFNEPIVLWGMAAGLTILSCLTIWLNNDNGK